MRTATVPRGDHPLATAARRKITVGDLIGRERLMAGFARRVGLGVAARGEVADVVGWAVEARERGLDSLWIHDSYFERDAVSYGSAVAARLGDPGAGDSFRLALGAVNPNTRHPVVLAMTGSALDEMAPGRIIMGPGTG